MSDSEAILNAITDLSRRVDQRFDRIDTKFDAVNTRITRAEKDIVRFKALGMFFSALLTFIGWDHIKLWLTSLTKS